MSADLKVGIHELLRYILPGYSFLFILFLPFILVRGYESIVVDWEKFLALILVGGLVIGYFLYYPYYWYFRNHLYTENKRESLRKIRLLPIGKKTDEDILALHSIAYHRTKDQEALEACKFQFSVIHSIGATAFSILGGYILSLIIVSLEFFRDPAHMTTLLMVEAWILLPISGFLIVLCSEYRYRFKLAVRIEDYIVMQNLKTIVEESESAWNEIQKMLSRKKAKA